MFFHTFLFFFIFRAVFFLVSLLNSQEFGILPPHFSAADPKINEKIEETLQISFPSLYKQNKPPPPFSKCHLQALFNTIIFSETFFLKTIHFSTLTSFVQDNLIHSLKSHIILEDHSPHMKSTGIPPYITVYKELHEIKTTLKNNPEEILAGVGDLLDENGVKSWYVTIHSSFIFIFLYFLSNLPIFPIF